MAGTNWADFTPVDNDAPTAVDWSQFEVIPKANAAQRMLDIGKSFASGGVGATKAIADAGGASNAVSKRLGGAQDALQDMLSPERQAERAMRAKTIADAEQSGSTLREVGAHLGGFAEAPISTIAEAAGSVVPVVASMFTPVGRRAGARAALSLGLGAAQGAGSVKGSIYDAVQQKHVEQGATPEAAQQAAEKAQAYSGPNLDSIGVGAVLGAVAGRSGVESTVNRIIGGKAAMGGQSVLRRAAVGTVAEGLPEAAQGGQERLSSNLALQKEGFEMPTWQGVAGQAASEGLAGGVLGGGINAASRGHARPAAQPGAPVNLDDPSVGVDSAAPPAIDPAAGPLSKAAAMAVDNGAGPAMPESTWTADTAGNVMTGEQRKAGVALADAAALVTPAPISELAAMVENLPVDVRRDARFTLKELQRQDLPAGVRAFHENQLRGLVGEQAPEVDPVDQQPLGDVTAAYDARTPTQTAPTWVRQYQESRLQGEQYPDLISYLDRLPREAELADAYFKDGQWEAQKQHFRATGMPHPEEAEVDDAYRMLQTKDAAVTPEQRAEALQTIRTVLDDELGDFDTDRAIDAPAQELSLVPNQPARYEGGIDYTAPARPVARPQVDRQSSDDATIARLALADNIEPGAAMRLDRAHALRRQAADAGIPVSVVPHPSGRGYAVAPTSRLDPAARNATPQSEAAATLPYDQSPSGRMLAGAAGAAGVRPELRGEAVSAGNAIQQQRAELDAERQRRDELGLSNTTPVRPVTQPAPTGQPALAYDTTPTGNMVAGIDGVRREIRADVINRNQASNAVVEKALDQPLAPEAPAQAATETVAPITADNRREEPGSARIGRDQRPLAEGGKPFKTRKAAGDAKKLQPMMRVVSVEGGYALADKTPGQLAAEAKASKRLSNASTSPAGEPIPAHAFIAAAGGLNVRAKPDMGIDGNPRVGNRTLFAGLGKGLTIERATEQLVENGYLSERASHNDAMALIKRSLSQPQYNADGIERIAEAETAARFEDYVAAQEDAFADGEPDPFSMPDDFTPDELEDVGYTAADPKLQAEVNALMAQVDAMGLDASEILEDIVRTYANASQDEFSAAAKRALEAAITRSSGDGGSVAAQTPAAADTPQELTAAGGLTGPTFTAKLAPGVNSLFGNPQYHEAEAYTQTLPRGQYAQVTTERAGYPPRPTLHGAWVSNGDGTASFVQDVFPASSVPLTDGSIAALYAAHVEKEQKQQTKSAAATKTRLELIESKRLRVGAEWAGAETYVEGRDGKTKFSKSKITAIGGNGFLTVESTLRGSNRLYRFTVDANSHLFDNYPTLERLVLNSPTRDDVLAQQERADTGAKAEAARKKSEDNKAQADAERGEFTLTGSDRAADVGAAGGQTPMFSRAPAAKADKAAAKAAAAKKSRDEAFAKWSDNAPMVTSAQAGGYTFKTGEKVVVEAYHGSQRPDRIGGVFDPKRATSGPMAYFTSSPELASTYAKGKSDTSLADEDQQYANWFKVKVPGQRSEVDIARAWSSLTPEQKATIEERMPDIRQDEDGNVVYEEGGGDPGSYEWELQQTQRGYDRRGNPLKAAVETWLTSGTLFDQELDFMKVLQLAGFPVKDVRPDFPTDQFPGVFKTFVAMKKPLVVSDIPAEVDAALAEAARRDRGRVQPQGADTWDKRARTVRDWYEQYKGLDSRDPAYAWTSIPDKVTDVFKAFGYDGIVDWSGKGGGHQHPVYIPFGPTQVKSAFNRGTFDPNKKDINFSRTPARKASDANLVATQQLVDGLKANWTNAPEIIVARNMQDAQIPQPVRDYDQTLKSQGATGEARGFIYQGKVYLLADQLNGPHQIAEVLFHEVLGHYGLRRAFGKGLTPILQQVATMRRKEMQAKAKEYGLDLTNERDRLTAAEEILAEMAQTTPEIGFVKRAIAVIRNWMRANVPGFQSLRLTDNDIIQKFLLPARGAVTRSKETGLQSIERAMGAFSRAPVADQTDTPAFKKWFGASQVVDADGKPLVVYHGTNVGINEFKPAKGLRSAGGLFESSATSPFKFFSPDKDEAQSYANAKGGHLLFSVYLRMERPLDSTTPDGLARMHRLFGSLDDTELSDWADSAVDLLDGIDELRATTPAEKSYFIKRDAKGRVIGQRATEREGYILEKYTAEDHAAEIERDLAQLIVEYEALLSAVPSSDAPLSVWAALDEPDSGDRLRAAGFDGLVFHENDGKKTFAVLDSTQIKSAVGNNGSFDPASPDIRFSRTTDAPVFGRAPATDTPAFKKWFGENGVADSDGNPRIFTHSGRPGLNIIHNQGRFGGIFVLPDGQNARYGDETYKLAMRGKIASTDDLREFANNSPEEVAAVLGEKVGSDAYESALEIVLDQSVTDDNAALVGGIDAADGFAEMQKLRGRIARAAGATAVEMEDEFGGDALLVVDGRQVKDVERNNGSFDPANPDIRFSRTAPGGIAARVGESLKSVTATNIKERAGFKLTDYLGLGLQLLGRRQLVDIYGDSLPLNQYNRLAQQMEADKNEVGAEADALATAWAKLPDERQLAELMHDATLAQMDPAKPLVAGDNAVQYGVLRKRFNDLTPEAQKVYLGARDSYQAHHKGVLKAIKERIERSELKGPRKAALLAQMDDEFYKAVKGVYFPLARFGQYVVVTTGPDGKVSNVSRAETMNEGQATRKQMLLAFPASKGYKVGKVILSKEFVAGRDAVGRGFMTELYAVLDKQDMDSAARAELEDTLGQLYLSSLPDLSWAKHGIHRKGTPGYSQDARRAFAQNMFHGARYLAKLRYSDLMQDELTAMQKHVDDWVEVPDADFNSARAQRVVDEFNKRHEAHMNPKSNPLSTALTSFGFIFHLGLSPASALVNLTQTALVAYPVMGAKWGFDKSAAALMKASQQAVQGKNDITGSLNEEERRAYDEAVRNGTIDVTMAHDLAGISQGEDAGVMWKIRPVMKWASFMFHHAERFNRQVTFVASYRLAREAGAAHEAAFEQATKATYDGHFDYSSANRPRVMQGNAARVLLLFKQYGQNMVYSLARSAQQSLKGATPQERTEARRVLGGLLAMHGMAAGALGLPMVTTLLAVASMLGGSDDEPWDAQVALQNMLADTFGQKPAEVLSHGLSRLTPWDISGRVGLDKLILPDIQEGLEGQRLGESAMAAALGPVAGIGINVLKGMQEIGEGRYQRGLEAMAPSVLRGPLKAWRYAWEGAKDKTGIVIQDEVDAAAWFGQALGFSPSSVRNATEGKSAILAHDRALQARRSGLVEQFAMASMAGDEEGKADARSDIATFNEKHPDRYIKPMQLAQSVRARTKRIEEAQDGVYLPKKRRDAMEAGRFAIE